jgi:hypothetical protein
MHPSCFSLAACYQILGNLIVTASPRLLDPSTQTFTWTFSAVKDVGQLLPGKTAQSKKRNSHVECLLARAAHQLSDAGGRFYQHYKKKL